VLAFALDNFVSDFSVEVAVKGVDCCLHCSDLFSLLVGNVKAEVLFHCHYKLHTVQGIEAQFFEGGRTVQLGLVALRGRFQHLIHLALDFLEQSRLGGVRGGGESVPGQRGAQVQGPDGIEFGELNSAAEEASSQHHACYYLEY
jgi:hypothetical protein